MRWMMLLAFVLAAASRSLAIDDHLECYDIRDELARGRSIASQNGLVPEAGCTILQPAKQLCIATSPVIAPVPPGHVDAALTRAFLCYDMRCPAAATTELPTVVDQFGARGVTTRRTTHRTICAPAEILPACDGGAEFPMCGGYCATGQVCQAATAVDLAKNLCVCVDQESTCGTDGTPLPCVGRCPPGLSCAATIGAAGACYGCFEP